MSVLVWIEQIDGQPVHSSWEVLGKGRDLADSLGSPLVALVVGNGVDAIAEEARSYGADTVLLAADPALERFRLQPYAAALQEAIHSTEATVILASATTNGRTLTGLVACQNQAGLAPDAVDLRIEEGKLVAVRSVYSGNILADIYYETDQQFASVRPRSFPAPEAGEARGEIRPLPVPVDESQVAEQILEVKPADTSEISLTDARIIVSGGRGVAKDPELGFKLVAELADVLGAAVGASRAAVDAGYIPYKHQVGQTGKTVKPDLYIAAGISGAIQHLAGMGQSKVIVAINKDPDAPIFERANYGIVGDLFQVLPALTKEFKKRLGKEEKE